MKTRALGSLPLFFLLVHAACSATSTRNAIAPAPQNPDARSQFEQLETLAGAWISTGGSAPGAKVEYSVTSSGTALLERLFAGSEHEMITLYYMDGDDLVLTHYSGLGNQPSMRAQPTAGNRIVFEFTGGANIDPSTSKHMHEGAFTFVDREHVNTEWRLVDQGKEVEIVRLELRRASAKKR